MYLKAGQVDLASALDKAGEATKNKAAQRKDVCVLFEAMHSHQQACCAINRRLDVLMGDTTCAVHKASSSITDREVFSPAREHDNFNGSTGFQYIIETSIPEQKSKPHQPSS